MKQLLALLALRWQMVRGAGVRISIVLAALLVGWLVQLLLTSGDLLSEPARLTAIELAPGAFLGFSLLAFIAPLTAGGGAEVVPPDQLVAFPVRPRTQFLGGLALAPLNLVWVVNMLAIAAMTAYLSVGASLARACVTSLAYVLCVTVLGQGFSWLVTGIRQSRRGRVLVAAGGVTALLVAAVVVRLGAGDAVLDGSPTHYVVDAEATQSLLRWGTTTGVLLALLAFGLWAGPAACRWSLRRADEQSERRSRPRRRRSDSPSPLRAMVAVDRASVWRAPALRRGGVVLAVLPGVLAAGAAVPWQSMIVLPGLVAAGAGLLFGINAFSLDGQGAVWLSSLPQRPALAARAKAIVLLETVLAAVAIAAVAGAARSPGAPTSAQAVAVVTSAVTCALLVTATALAMSVKRPHRADLRGPRDAIAPPGALALASVRLALPAACLGALVEVSARTGLWWWPLVVTAPVLLLCLLSLLRSLSSYADPVVRARVVHAVSSG